MDVVRKNIEDLRGAVEIQSWPGKGTLFRIRLPLTLAIIEGMVVRLEREKFIIPLLSIIESVRLTAANQSTIGGDGEILRWREEVLSLVRLADVLQMHSVNGDAQEAICIIVEGDGKRAALVVDEIEGQQQVVIKSIDAHYRKVDGVTGATMLGSGEVALILDVPGILKQVLSKGRDSWL
jgi:two-component system chemotaxis sensor kinase CheA